jgi:hypothetical protein
VYLFARRHQAPDDSDVVGCFLDGDFGVRRVGPLSFECELTVDGWRSVVSLLEQFCNSKTKRFQWLTQRGRICFLISLDGQWGTPQLVV